MNDLKVKQQVRQFYDRVGWQTIEDGLYQNTRYEDLRPVSSDYIHRCHLRMNRFLTPQGCFLLDAGSGPIQYPEYLTYSEGYNYRVCVDISLVALQEAYRRIGDHGLYVVADVANLPFKPDCFEGVVSLHTLHHLPAAEQISAYQALYRVLSPGNAMVIVNGWTDSPLMRWSQWLVNFMEGLGNLIIRIKKGKEAAQPVTDTKDISDSPAGQKPGGTFIEKMDAKRLHKELDGHFNFEIWVWRSVNVRFLRAVIHRAAAGRLLLRMLYWLEERFPHFLGEKGQYPMLVIRKETRREIAS